MTRTARWLTAALAAALAAPATAETYKIDPMHSDVTFRVAHMVVSKVTGRFDKFAGEVVYDTADQKGWKAEAAIEAASVNTNVEQRDKHLRSPDFLDVEKFPRITFKSTKVAEVKKNHAKLIGDLTIHGVTKRVVLDVEIGGTIKGPDGRQRVGATATTMINRKDFGLVWNKALEAGGFAVGDDVEITLSIEGVAQEAAKKIPA